MNKPGVSGVKCFLIILTLIATSFIMLACPMPTLLADGGSLKINITSGETAGSRSLETVRFVVSGTGPNGETFSQESYEQNITVNNLTSGSWTIQVAGYNSSDQLIVMGQSPIDVEVYGETAIDITLSPVDGEGDIMISASWDGSFTVNPTVTAVIESGDGNETSYNLTVTGGNHAEQLVSTLPAGFYRVSIQLYDDGALTAGSVWTVMVLDGIITEATATFDSLNKAGERIVISDPAFTLAWDTDSATDEYYRVYARERGSYEWTFIEEITAAPTPEFEINTTNLTYGVWEFAVSAVEGGVESDLHTSMDDNAIPVSGWFIDWIEI